MSWRPMQAPLTVGSKRHAIDGKRCGDWVCGLARQDGGAFLTRDGVRSRRDDGGCRKVVALRPTPNYPCGSAACARHSFAAVCIFVVPAQAGARRAENARRAGPKERAKRVTQLRQSPLVAISRTGRLRGGRFDVLPAAESLFFCWPKRKVTQRKWPSEPRLLAI